MQTMMSRRVSFSCIFAQQSALFRIRPKGEHYRRWSSILVRSKEPIQSSEGQHGQHNLYLLILRLLLREVPYILGTCLWLTAPQAG